MDYRKIAGIVLVALGAFGGAYLFAPAPARGGAESPREAPMARDDDAPLGHDIALEVPDGALAHFYDRLREAERGEGQARVLFYGGSHTASDLMSGRVRETLQARFGDLGHGYVAMAPVVTDAWAWGVRIGGEGFGVHQVGFKHREIDRYGLAGVAFIAEEPHAYAFVESDHWGNGRFASRIELLFDRRPGGGSLEVWLDGQHRETRSAEASVAVGGRAVFAVSDGPHRIEVRPRGDGPVAIFGVIMEREGAGVLVENLGLVGSKARHQLLWDEVLWRRYFVRRRPDLVALAYGNNETTDTHLEIADHEAHLRATLARIRAAAPRASCLLIGPTDRPRVLDDDTLEPRAVVAELTEMQRRLARESGCAFFDTLAFQGGLGASVVWLAHDPPYMRDDRLHLTRRGYLRWGDALTQALLDGYRAP